MTRRALRPDPAPFGDMPKTPPAAPKSRKPTRSKAARWRDFAAMVETNPGRPASRAAPKARPAPRREADAWTFRGDELPADVVGSAPHATGDEPDPLDRKEPESR